MNRALRPFGRVRRWFDENRARLMSIQDTPHSIALGSAIGIFFGFTPLLSVKTLLSVAVAWLFRSNKIAAALTVTLHDVLLPLMPAIYLWEYKLGVLALRGEMPAAVTLQHTALREYMKWTTFFHVGLPILVGSLFIALPSAVIAYFVLRGILERSRNRRAQA